MKADAFWLKRSEAALLLGCSVETLDRQIRPRLAKKHEKGQREKHRIDARALVAAWTAHQIEKEKPAARSEDSIDQSLVEQRQLDNEMRRYRNAELRGELVNLEHLRNGMIAGLRAFQRAGERIKTRFGNDACDLFNAAVKDFDDAVQRAIAAAEDDERRRIRNGSTLRLDELGHAGPAPSEAGGVRRAGNRGSDRAARRA